MRIISNMCYLFYVDQPVSHHRWNHEHFIDSWRTYKGTLIHLHVISLSLSFYWISQPSNRNDMRPSLEPATCTAYYDYDYIHHRGDLVSGDHISGFPRYLHTYEYFQVCFLSGSGKIPLFIQFSFTPSFRFSSLSV